MCRLMILAALTLVSCETPPATGYREERVKPRYAILTTVPPDSPMRRPLNYLARKRWASKNIIHFTDLEKDKISITRLLREIAPTYVLVILHPAMLDTNFQMAFLELACGLDTDPFPDFIYGYLPARDVKELDHLVQIIRGAEAKVEKRLTRVTHLRPGAADSKMSSGILAWAQKIPTYSIDVKEGDTMYLHERFPDIEASDYLILQGEGTAEGIRGLPRRDIRDLQLDTTCVFSGADYTGVLLSTFDRSGHAVRRRAIEPDYSFALQLLKDGVANAFVPLEKTHPALTEYEWVEALLCGEALGWAMKHAYDVAILARPGAPAPAFGRFRVGEPPPSGLDGPFFTAATRILLGDPILQPFRRDTLPPVVQEGVSTETDKRGRTITFIHFRVANAKGAPFFEDPFSEDQRIHLKILCSQGTKSGAAVLKSCMLKDQPVEARLSSFALETWRGKNYLHVLIHGKELAQVGLELTVAVSLK